MMNNLKLTVIIIEILRNSLEIRVFYWKRMYMNSWFYDFGRVCFRLGKVLIWLCSWRVFDYNKKDCRCKCADFYIKIFAIQSFFFGKFDRIVLVSSRTVSTTRSVSSITILALNIASYRKYVKRHFEECVDIWLLFVYR